jgi:MSHA biogenesis protein MshL
MLSLAGCATKPPPAMPVQQTIDEALAEALAKRPIPTQAAQPAQAEPPQSVELTTIPVEPEARISLSLSNVPARQFFMALTSGTNYTMLVHPGVTGLLSAQMKDVTITDALEAIRDMYGIDYVMTDKRILVKMPALETRVFQVNYLNGSRKGSSDTRVAAGSLADIPVAGAAAAPAAQAPSGRSSDSSRISTSSDTDFWPEVKAALEALMGTTGNGRSIVISPQSGVVVVRAMPKELRDIGAYLKAAQLSIERQVILEAKIIEVQLSDGYQSGINWSGFRANGNNRGSLGVVQQGSSLSSSASGAPLTSSNLTSQAGINLIGAAAAGGTLFGLALQGANFAALISFLETQGAVQVLSSPRISTLNNQKAVLKIGTDEFFVTGVSGGTTTPSAGGAITTTPNVTLRPFFSGVVLDVLPQIDGDGNIILHVRPSVSQVTTVNKIINLGSSGQLTLPLASSSASEADSVVRAKTGQVIVIGGLMRQSGSRDRSQLPGFGEVPGAGVLFGNTSITNQKRELVILLKPTVIQNDETWTDDVQKTRQHLKQIGVRESKEK